MQDVRHIHQQVMSLVWDVEPPPDATPEEGPGSFRQHEIEEFSSGMKPPSWPLVDAEITVFLTTENCQAGYEELRSRGVEFTEEPHEMPYGIDCGFRDPSGNSVRLTQLAELPANTG